MEWDISISGVDAHHLEEKIRNRFSVVGSRNLPNYLEMQVLASEEDWEAFFNSLEPSTYRSVDIHGGFEPRPSEPYDTRRTFSAQGGVQRGLFLQASWSKVRNALTKEAFISHWWEDTGTIYEKVAPWHTQGISFDQGIEFLRSGNPWTKVWEMQILTLLYHTDAQSSHVLCEYLFNHSARGRHISVVGLLPFKDEL